LFVSYCRDLHQFVTIDKPKLVRWEENNWKTCLYSDARLKFTLRP
jgi:hypothetical protein